MMKIIQLVGIVVCILLAIGLAVLSMYADETMYMVYLIAASLLGVMVGVLKNLGKRS
jgi:hypothetical protein